MYHFWINEYNVVDTDLKTAKALKQVEADKLRLAEHLKQKPLVWERTHSDRKIVWYGTIDNVLYVTLRKN